MIEAVLYSYKNKNLKLVVDSLIKKTKHEIFIHVKDQHNIDRRQLFAGPEYEDKLFYSHVFWDSHIGPVHYKKEAAKSSSSEYFLVLSDDIVVSNNWDKALIDFLNNKKSVVSGSGKLSVKNKNLFFLKQERAYDESFSKSYFVDKNFIFGKAKYLKNIYPIDIKYHGEDESSSLALYEQGIEIFSVPSSLITDLKIRTLENKYVPFSLDHNYNLVVDKLHLAPPEFLSLNKIVPESLNRLPYENNDIAYSPSSLAFQDLDGRKFIETVNGIF